MSTFRNAGIVGVLLIAATGLTALLLHLVRQDPPGGRVRDERLSDAELTAACDRARARFNAGDREGAERRLRDLLEQAPSWAPARVLLGQIVWQRRDPEALELWESVTAATPRDYSIARYLKGSAAIELGNSLDAESALREAIRVLPDNLTAIDTLLDLYALQRRVHDMRQLLASRNRIQPASSRHMAMDLLAGGSLFAPDQALPVLRRFRSVEGLTRHTQIGLAMTLREAGQTEEALQVLDTPLDPPSAAADAAGNTGAAPPADTTAATDPLALRLLLLIETGQLAAAQDVAGSLVDREPLTPIANHALGAWCLRTGHPQLALTLLRRAVSQAPLRAAIWNRAGQAAAGAGEPDVAASCLERGGLADDLERDAYLILRGTDDRRLLGATARQIADTLAGLDQQNRAAAWNELADLQLAVPARPADPVVMDRYSQAISQTPSATFPDSPLSASAADDAEPLAELRRVLQRAVASPPPTSNPPLGPDAGPSLTDFALTDVAASRGLSFTYDPGHSGRQLIVETIGGGVAVLDFDGDNRPDLFFPQGGHAALQAALNGTPADATEPTTAGDRLFRNRGDGTWQDVTRPAGIRGTTYSLGCAAGDLDNDGDDDLVVGTIGHPILYRNRGDGTFSRERLLSVDPAVTAGIGIGDFDGDGLSDLWLVNYVEDWRRSCRTPDGDFRTCLPASFESQPDTILLAQGDGSWTGVSTTALVDEQGRGLGIVTLDINADGRADAYVANDGSANHLFGSTVAGATSLFIERGLASGCALSGDGRAEAGMGIAVADFDRDLTPDLFVTNFFQESNRLYRGTASGTFLDVSAAWRLPSLTLPVLGFGVQPADFNGDGLTDVLIANGHISDFRNEGQPYRMKPLLLANASARRFLSVSAGEFFETPRLGRAVATLDADRDGRVDAVVVHQDDPVALLQNTAGVPAGLRFRLVGQRSNRDAVGAVADARIADQRYREFVLGTHGFMATNERTLRFPAAAADACAVSIRWPSGETTESDSLSAGQPMILLEDGRRYSDPD